MSGIRKRISYYTCIFACIFAVGMMFSSCETDDLGMENELLGSWRVVEVPTGIAPYAAGDYLYLSNDRTATITGADNYVEYFSDWWVNSGTLNMVLSGSNYSLNCRIYSYQGDYLSLDVYDQERGTSYTMRLVRDNSWNYYSKRATAKP